MHLLCHFLMFFSHIWSTAILSRATFQRPWLFPSASEQLRSIRAQRGHAGGLVAWP